MKVEKKPVEHLAELKISSEHDGTESLSGAPSVFFERGGSMLRGHASPVAN